MSSSAGARAGTRADRMQPSLALGVSLLNRRAAAWSRGFSGIKRLARLRLGNGPQRARSGSAPRRSARPPSYGSLRNSCGRATRPCSSSRMRLTGRRTSALRSGRTNLPGLKRSCRSRHGRRRPLGRRRGSSGWRRSCRAGRRSCSCRSRPCGQRRTRLSGPRRCWGPGWRWCRSRSGWSHWGHRSR
jgi:hypothetical protein